MIARKLDSDYTIVRRLIRRQAREVVNELVPERRSHNFVQNYVFGSGGTGGFGGTGTGVGDKTTGVVYDPANPGTQYTQTRAKIQGHQGVYLQDNSGEDAINIHADAVNDPVWWLGL